jgi:hypothetical protein
VLVAKFLLVLVEKVLLPLPGTRGFGLVTQLRGSNGFGMLTPDTFEDPWIMPAGFWKEKVRMNPLVAKVRACISRARLPPGMWRLRALDMLDMPARLKAFSMDIVMILVLFFFFDNFSISISMNG